MPPRIDAEAGPFATVAFCPTNALAGHPTTVYLSGFCCGKRHRRCL